jgi:chromosome segregation ATPase
MTEECIRDCKSTMCAYSPHCITPLERNDFCYLSPIKWKQIQEKMEKKKMTEEEKEKIINAFNNAWNKKIASENSYGKLASKEMFENKGEILRLEQENKELKEKIIELSEEKGHLIVENNTLKESSQSLSMLGTDLASANETVRKDFFRADKNKDMWREKAENYRLALEKIRENIQNWINSPWSCFNCRNNMDERLTEIKNKINEVLK